MRFTRALGALIGAVSLVAVSIPVGYSVGSPVLPAAVTIPESCNLSEDQQPYVEFSHRAVELQEASPTDPARTETLIAGETGTVYVRLSVSEVSTTALDTAWIVLEFPGDVVSWAEHSDTSVTGVRQGIFLPGSSAAPAKMVIKATDVKESWVVGIPVNFQFYPGIVPEDYVLEPEAKVYYDDGSGNPSGCVLKDATGTSGELEKKAQFKVEYNTPNIGKTISKPKNYQDLSNAGTNATKEIFVNSQYVDTVGDKSYMKDPGKDITFYFGENQFLQTSSSNYTGHKLQFFDSVTIADTLPTYKNQNGEEVRATFDSSKNPGWDYCPDSTIQVCYTYENPDFGQVADYIQTQSGKKTVADKDYQQKYNTVGRALENLTLVLNFPGMEIKSGTVSATNQVNVTAKAWNGAVDGQTFTVADTTASATRKITFTADITQGEFKKMLLGTTVNDSSVQVDPGYMHQVSSKFYIQYTSPTNEAVGTKNLVIEDSYASGAAVAGTGNNESPEGHGIPLDMYVQSVWCLASGFALKDFLGDEGYIELIKPGGSEKLYVDQGLTANKLPTTESQAITVNQSVAQALEAQGATGSGLDHTEVEVTGVRLVQDPDFVMKSGDKVELYVKLASLKPNSITSYADAKAANADKSPEQGGSASGTGWRTNWAQTSATMVILDDAGSPTENTSEMKENPKKDFYYQNRQESITLSKIASSQKDKKEGGDVKYNIRLTFSGMSKGFTFNDFQIVDLLPEGLDLYTTTGKKWEHDTPVSNLFTNINTKPWVDWDNAAYVPNYGGSGRAALVIPFLNTNPSTGKPWTVADIYAEGANGFMEFGIATKINRFAPSGTNLEENRNYAFILGKDAKGNDLNGDNGYFKKNNVTTNYGNANYKQAADIFGIAGEDGTADFIYGMYADIDVQKGEEVRARKWIKDINGVGTEEITTKYGEDYYYYLELLNSSTTPRSPITVYEALPYQGDSNYGLDSTNGENRASQFTDSLRGPVECLTSIANKTKCEDGKYNILYSTSQSQDIPTAIAATGWMDEQEAANTGWDKIRSIKIVLNTGYTLDGKSSDFFQIPAKAPTFDPDKATMNAIGKNNFAVNYTSSLTTQSNWNLSNTVTNTLPTQIKVTKHWDGLAADSATVELLRKIQGSNDNPTVATYDDDGDPKTPEVDAEITLSADNNWTGWLYNLSASTDKGEIYEYSVQETGVGIDTADSTNSTLTPGQAGYDVSVTGDSLSGFTVTNSWNSPEIPLTVDTEWTNYVSASTKHTITLALNKVVRDPNTGEQTLVPVTSADGKAVTVDVDTDAVNQTNSAGNATSTPVSFGNQPVFEADGSPITYTVTVEGYEDTKWQEKSVPQIIPARLSDADTPGDETDDVMLSAKDWVADPPQTDELSETNIHVVMNHPAQTPDPGSDQPGKDPTADPDPGSGSMQPGGSGSSGGGYTGETPKDPDTQPTPEAQPSDTPAPQPVTVSEYPIVPVPEGTPRGPVDSSHAAIGDGVWQDTNNNGVWDSGEKPLAGVKVELIDKNGQVIGVTQTDNQGQYLFNNVTPGTYRVRFTAPPGTDFTAIGLNGFQPDGSQYGMSGWFTVSPGEYVKDLNAGLYGQPDGSLANTGVDSAKTLQAALLLLAAGAIAFITARRREQSEHNRRGTARSR